MNYYDNNFYGGYSYGQRTPMTPPPNQVVPQPQQTMVPSTIPFNGLNGKIVDSEEVVRATEVPMGGYGVFPKADLSKVYIKSWNPNGTTSVIAYEPIVPETPPDPIAINNSALKQLAEKIDVLEGKIDKIFNIPLPIANKPQQQIDMQPQQSLQQKTQAPQTQQKEGVLTHAY